MKMMTEDEVRLQLGVLRNQSKRNQNIKAFLTVHLRL